VNKKNLLNFSYEELEEYFVNILKQKKFRVTQIADWVYKKHVFDFDEMSNLSKDQKILFTEHFYIGIPEIVKISKSKQDGTTKFLMMLEDGKTVESVLMYYPNRISACISSQVGCALKCEFCATGKMGFERNLTTGEILGQVLAMEKFKDANINNLVYMGMGEPLLNYDNVIKSVKMLNDEKLRKLGGRHITISTSGIADKIEILNELGVEIRLSVSLHAATNAQRDKIMPINRKYPLEQLIQSCKIYQQKTNKRVTFEYTVIKGFNDSKKDAEDLIALLSNLKSMINLIPVNPNSAGLERPSDRFLFDFYNIIKNKGIDVSIRAEKGTDIEAACGQLKTRYEND